MATSGFLKVDRSSLKTVAMKETPFNASDFPAKAKDAYNYIANPNSQEEVSVTKPQLNSTIGVKLGADTNTSLTTASWGGFIERPANKRGYYFPLDSNLNGYDLLDMVEDSYENKIKAYLKDHPEGVPEGYKPASVEGRDVAWNQLIRQFPNISLTLGGLSFSTDATGLYTITSSASGGRNALNFLTGSSSMASEPFKFRKGHVYYVKVPTGGAYFVEDSSYSIITTLSDSDSIGDFMRWSAEDLLCPWLGVNYSEGSWTGRALIVDIKQMFPTDTPTSLSDPRITWLKAYLAEHPEYNAGTIVNNNVTSVVSEGVNLWDEQWEVGSIDITTGADTADSTRIRSRNYTPVEAGSIYHVVSPKTLIVLYYDSSKTYMSYEGWRAGANKLIPSGVAFIRFYIVSQTTYNHDIAIIKGTSGAYVPYLPPVTISLPSICSNLHGVGTARDKVSFVNRVYENMKTYTFTGNEAWRQGLNAWLFDFDADSVRPATDDYVANVLSDTVPNVPVNRMNDGGIKNGIGISTSGKLYIGAETYANRASLTGKTIHYEATSGGQRYEARVLERKAEMVDLGSLPASVWTYNNVDYGSPVLYTTNGLFRKAKGYDILCSSKYSVVASESWTAMADKSITGSRSAAYLAIKDTSMTSKEQFLAAIDGIMLLYPLATPEILDVTEVVPMKPVEERIPNIVGSFSTGYENDGLCTYEGAFPSRTSIVNLIDNSTVKNNWVNAVVSVIGHTPINARDGISILPSNMSNDTRRTFSFTPTTTGKYHFSFYARLSGDARSYSSSSLRGISLTISPNPTASYDITAPRLIRGSNVYNLEYEWNRYGKCISLNANTTYTITLNWYASNNWRRSDTPLKICGVLLESGSFLSPYDVKGTDINGSGRSITSVIRPLFFNLARLDGALEDPTKSWMVTYLRKINTNSQATGPNTHGDNFGLGNYGYSGNNILGDTSTGEQASDYYNCWEKVIFYHKANETEFKYEVFNTETNKHYSITRQDSSITHQTVGNVQYNLSLGTLVASSSLQDSDNAQYRDLLYVPNVTEEEYLAEINKYFEVEKVRMTYEKTGEDLITVTDALTIKKTNLLEGSTLEY